VDDFVVKYCFNLSFLFPPISPFRPFFRAGREMLVQLSSDVFIQAIDLRTPLLSSGGVALGPRAFFS